MTATNIEAPTVEEIDLSGVNDNSRISDMAAFASARANLLDTLKKGLAEAKRYGNVTRAIAEARVQIRSLIEKSPGLPDWGAQSDVYRTVVSIAESTMLGTGDAAARTNLSAAVRQQVSRGGALLRGVVAYIVTHEQGFGEEAAKLSDPAKYDAALAEIIAAPSDALKKRVRWHFEKSKLTVPAGFGAAETVKSPSVGGPQGDEKSKVEAAGTAMDTLGTLAPDVALATLHRGLTAVAEALVEGKVSNIENRERVEKTLLRISAQSGTLAKIVAGKASPEEIDGLAKFAYADEK